MYHENFVSFGKSPVAVQLAVESALIIRPLLAAKQSAPNQLVP
jgi:hypothetical protein